MTVQSSATAQRPQAQHRLDIRGCACYTAHKRKTKKKKNTHTKGRKRGPAVHPLPHKTAAPHAHACRCTDSMQHTGAAQQRNSGPEPGSRYNNIRRVHQIRESGRTGPTPPLVPRSTRLLGTPSPRGAAPLCPMLLSPLQPSRLALPTASCTRPS